MFSSLYFEGARKQRAKGKNSHSREKPLDGRHGPATKRDDYLTIPPPKNRKFNQAICVKKPLGSLFDHCKGPMVSDMEGPGGGKEFQISAPGHVGFIWEALPVS